MSTLRGRRAGQDPGIATALPSALAEYGNTTSAAAHLPPVSKIGIWSSRIPQTERNQNIFVARIKIFLCIFGSTRPPARSALCLHPPSGARAAAAPSRQRPGSRSPQLPARPRAGGPSGAAVLSPAQQRPKGPRRGEHRAWTRARLSAGLGGCPQLLSVYRTKSSQGRRDQDFLVSKCNKHPRGLYTPTVLEILKWRNKKF